MDVRGRLSPRIRHAMLSLLFPSVLDAGRGDNVHPYVHYARPAYPMPLCLVQFGMHITQPSYGYGPAIRDHDLIHFVFRGRGNVTTAGRRFEVFAGQLFYLRRGAVSYYEANDEAPWYYAWIGFDGPWGGAILAESGLNEDNPVAQIPDMPRCYALCEAMLKAFLSSDDYLAMTGLCYQLMDDLRQLTFPPQKQSVLPEIHRETADSWLNAVISKVEAGYRSDLSVQALADEVGVSRTHLTEEFKKVTGRSVKRYITELRMERAKMHMIRTKRSIKDIALDCGYSDPLFFSRMFKKYYGMSPQEYRKWLSSKEDF